MICLIIGTLTDRLNLQMQLSTNNFICYNKYFNVTLFAKVQHKSLTQPMPTESHLWLKLTTY